MFGESFLRDFFGMNGPGPWSLGDHIYQSQLPGFKYERSVIERALKLAEGLPPEGNIAPYVELIRAADRLKVDVVRRP